MMRRCYFCDNSPLEDGYFCWDCQEKIYADLLTDPISDLHPVDDSNLEYFSTY